MSPDDGGSAVELLERRRDVLATLGEDPLHVRDLCDALDVSRSTVTRALRELEDAGWATRTDGGYARTTTGALALQEYRDKTTALDAVREHADALSPLPPDTPFAPRVLADARVETTADAPAFELSGNVRETFSRASAVRGVWPTVTDDRTPRTVARIADDGGSVALAVDEDVRSTLRSVAPELFDRGGRGASVVETSDDVPANLGVFAVDTAEGRSVLVVVYTDEGTVHAVAEAPADEDVSNWAASVFEAAGVPTGDDGGTTADPVVTGGSVAASWDGATRDLLRSQGFRSVEPTTLDRQPTRSPATMLRTTPTLAAVAEGQTLDREHVVDGERREFALDLVDALADGGNLALVGPPGSGKSTTCKAVACRWYDREFGPVCYRESESSAVLDDPLSLAAALADTDGTPLVVVEDAVRPAGNAVFEAVEELAGRDVAFLFDARRAEWSSPPEPLDPRRESLRRTGVEMVRMPSLDDPERERLHHHVDAIVDGPLPPMAEFVATDDDLADDSWGTPQATGSEGAGELLTLAHRYGLAAEAPVDADRHEVSPLARSVRDVYDAVADDGDQLVVATLVNVLNAAGLPVERDLVDALAVAPDGPDEDAVTAAMDALRDRVLFPGDDGLDLVHDAWSQTFLARLVADRDEASAHRTFVRGVAPMFDLVTDPDLREAVVGYRQGDAPTVRAFDDSPDHWRDVVVDRIYDLGRQSPGLAPLYGHPEHTELELPESCSSWCRRLALVGGAQMYVDAGDYDVALAECDRIESFAESADSERQRLQLRAGSLEVRSIVAERRGKFDESRELCLEGLPLAREAGNRKKEAALLNGLGLLAWYQNDVDEAERRFEHALDLYDEVQAPQSEANALNNLGIVHRERGDLAAATEYFSESHRRRREIGARVMAVDSAINLGVVARDRGELDDAVGWYRMAVEESATLGISGQEAHASRALGNALRTRGDLEESAERLSFALERAREDDRRHGECLCLRGLAATKRAQGELDEAAALVEECLALCEDVADERDRSLARVQRGTVELARGNAEAAATELTDAVETLEELDRMPGLARAWRWTARALDAAGEHERARRAYETAVDRFDSLDATPYLRETLDELTEVCERVGADETASTYRNRRDALGANN